MYVRMLVFDFYLRYVSCHSMNIFGKICVSKRSFAIGFRGTQIHRTLNLKMKNGQIPTDDNEEHRGKMPSVRLTCI